MTTVIGLSGSLRKGSYNTALLRAAAAHAPSGMTVQVESIAGIPLYDGDLEEAKGVPAAVTALQERIATADGLILATPEYNNGLPGVFKNAIDWLTRPPGITAKVFANKPAALMGATTGGNGTIAAQISWLPVLRALRLRLWTEQGPFYLSQAGKTFDDSGAMTDQAKIEAVTKYMAGFAAYVEACGA